MKKIFFSLIFTAVLGTEALAQKYRTTAGVRFGRQQVGFTAQQLILPNSTLEFLGMIGSRDANATLLFEQHFPILGRGLNYYVGGGGHVGSLKDHGTYVGADAILGIETKIPIFRLTVSADIKPAVHAGHEDWFTWETGLSLRYIVVKEKKKKRGGLFGLGKVKEPEKKGLFGRKKEEETKSKFKLFGDGQKEEEVKTKQKFRLFEKEEEQKEEVKTKQKFKLFDSAEPEQPKQPEPTEKKGWRWLLD